MGGHQPGRVALGDHPAVVDDAQTVAKPLGLFHGVGGEKNGHALALEVQEPVPQGVARLGVQAGGGFVEDEQVRPVDDGPGQHEPAGHAAGEFLVLKALFAFQGEKGQQLLGPELGLGPGDAEIAGEDEEIFEDA